MTSDLSQYIHIVETELAKLKEETAQISTLDIPDTRAAALVAIQLRYARASILAQAALLEELKNYELHTTAN